MQHIYSGYQRVIDEIACENCGAEKGCPCIRPDGIEFRSGLHIVRWEAGELLLGVKNEPVVNRSTGKLMRFDALGLLRKTTGKPYNCVGGYTA